MNGYAMFGDERVTILPCPFCGGEPMLSPQVPGYCGARVECMECDASSGSVKVPGDPDAGDRAAIDRWNRRADTSDAP